MVRDDAVKAVIEKKLKCRVDYVEEVRRIGPRATYHASKEETGEVVEMTLTDYEISRARV